MVPGQTLTTQATAFAGRPNYIPVNTMTLMLQTINGTVIAVSTSGALPQPVPPGTRSVEKRADSAFAVHAAYTPLTALAG